jgi:hypothetical protein
MARFARIEHTNRPELAEVMSAVKRSSRSRSLMVLEAASIGADRIQREKFCGHGIDVYMVTVVKPEGIGDLIDEDGTLTEHGKFSFDLTEEIAIETELEIEITGVGSSTGIF